jgi:hypothetical protein
VDKDKPGRGAVDKDRANFKDGPAYKDKADYKATPNRGTDKGAKGRQPAAKDKGDWGAGADTKGERRPADKAPPFRRDERLAKPPADLARGPGGARGRPEKSADAVSQAEAALKALRESRDPEARRRAAEALERAARQLRGPADKEAPPAGEPRRP